LPALGRELFPAQLADSCAGRSGDLIFSRFTFRRIRQN
jgi:hypothetical protein